MIKNYNKMKTSVVNNQQEEADLMLEKFKLTHKHMLADKEIIQDFIETTMDIDAHAPNKGYILLLKINISLSFFILLVIKYYRYKLSSLIAT